MFWPAIVISITSWWLLTGIALIAVHQPERRRRVVFVLVSLIMMTTWFVIPSNVIDSSPLASAVGFILGLLIWAWLEISYLLGFVTGPNHKPCPEGATGWQRFIGGLGTTLYHELAVLMMVALLGWISYGSIISSKKEVVSLNPKLSSASALCGEGVTEYLCSLLGALTGISVYWST